MSNNTSTEQCFKVVAEASPPLFQNGKIVLQTYHIGWIISGSLALIAIVTSFWLIRKHLRCYTNKREQRYIVRLLFMVPLYASISFASFLFWNHSTPIILIRDAYEAIVLTAFFYLLLMYLSHDTEEQRRIFSKVGLSVEADAIAIQKGQKVAKWVFPLGFVKWKPRDGLYFLQLMKWGVLQYCVIRPTTTLAAVILNYIGLYCESSWALGWGHIYITIIMSVSVTIAMYCLIQLYVPVAKELAVHKPLLKLFSVKAVVFLTFWQATFLSLLSMFGIVKDTKYMTAEDVNNAISALLETFEMMVFAFLHIRAFTYKPYSKPSKGLYPSQTPQWRSLGHAMDFRETFREIWVGCIYMFDKMRGKEPTPDFGVIREAHYEGAFGRQRLLHDRPRSPRQQDRKIRANDSTLPTVHIEVDREVEVEVNGQRQWLPIEMTDRQRFGHPEREKSEGLQEQIERELERLGYPKHNLDKDDHKPDVGLQPAGQRSWWRNIYNRISQSGHEPEESEKEPFTQRRMSRFRSYHRNDSLKANGRDIDHQPLQGILHPSKAHPSTVAYHDYDDVFAEEDDRLPQSNRNASRLANQPQDKDRPILLPTSSLYASARTSRSPHSGQTPQLVSYSGPNGSYGPMSSVRSPPSQGNTFASPISGTQIGSSSMSSKDFPALPSPAPRSSRPAQHASPYAWSPPPTPSKGPSESNIQGDTPQHRKSSHRREPATTPRDQPNRRRESKLSPPSRLTRYSGMPLANVADERSYTPEVNYVGQPTNEHITFHNLQ